MTIEAKDVKTKGFAVKPARRHRARTGPHIFANAASDNFYRDIETPTWPGSGRPGDQAVSGIDVGGVEVDTAIGVIHGRNQRLYLDVTDMLARANQPPVSMAVVMEWAQYLPLFMEKVSTERAESLQRAAQAYQPTAQLRPIDLELLEMQKRDAESILSGTRWLTAVEVAHEKNKALRNRNALANRWKNEGRVFAIKHEGVERYPRYAFDARMEPLPVISEVISRFGPQPDAWNIASWFESTNAWLKSRRPREILDDPEKLLWALDQRKGWMHG